MAESVLLITLGKITAALGADVLQQIRNLLPTEVSLFGQLTGRMNRIKKELSVIHAFLSQADLQGVQTRTVEAWVDAVRKVALDVEDASKSVDGSLQSKENLEDLNTFVCGFKLLNG
uniref:Disease resistance N-terminal domain-containing protein n=1 Tax=Oryza barthii TaxID=65489 RepID=A0A0D3FTS5_9ORYZ